MQYHTLLILYPLIPKVELQLLTWLGPFYLGSIGTGIGSSLGAGGAAGAAGLGYMRPSLNLFLHCLRKKKKEPIKIEFIKAVGGGPQAILFKKSVPIH